MFFKFLFNYSIVKPEFSGYYYYQGILNKPDASNLPAFEIWGPQKRFGLIGLKDPEAFWFGATEQNLSDSPHSFSP